MLAGLLAGLLDELKLPLCAFAASRLALLCVGLLTQIFITPLVATAPPATISSHQVLNIWARWDAGWYLTLANNGYQPSPAAGGQANWAFFPAYPTLASLLSRLTHLPLLPAMLVISNASFLLALVLIHRLARAEFDRRTADVAVVLLCAAPGSYIFSAAYTESLFLAALTGSFLLLRSRRWIAAGAAAGLAALTRNLGVGLVILFAWDGVGELWTAFRNRRVTAAPVAACAGSLLRIACGAAIPLLALAGFCLVLQARTGDPFAFMHIQKAWGRTIGVPFASPLRGLRWPSGIVEGNLINFAASWAALALVAVLATMRRWRLLLLAVFLTLVPLAAGVGSYARFTLVIVPLWLAAAKLLSDRPAAVAPTVLILATVNGFMMVAWTLGLGVTM